MKMIVAILADDKTEKVADDLLEAGFRVTKFASTAGFLTVGTTTLMIGVQDEDVEDALGIIRKGFSPLNSENNVQATIYVLNASSFKRIP